MTIRHKLRELAAQLPQRLGVREVLPLPEPHAVTRARERYGLSLSPKSLAKLAERCAAREGLLETYPDGRTQHMVIFEEQVLWVVYRSQKAGSHRSCGTVITVLPQEAAYRRVWRDRAYMKRRKYGHQ